METLLRYRGREVTDQDASFIQDLIRANLSASRWALSVKLCEAWNWRQPNGNLRDMVCRGLMLALHRAGHIEPPPARRPPRDSHVLRPKPLPVETDRTPLRCRLADLGPLTFLQVRRRPEEPLFDGLIEMHHYLGYTRPVGEHLKYLVFSGERPVACFAWSSAPRHLGPRDRHIGWSADQLRRNIRFVAYNTRFLIPPWVEVPHLASHLLGRMTRILPGEWQRVYGHPVYFAETFVDPARNRGTCYYAANWVYLGQTTGRGKDDHTNKVNRSIKDVLGLALVRRFRQRLVEEG